MNTFNMRKHLLGRDFNPNNYGCHVDDDQNILTVFLYNLSG
jgi:hypothetical protein